MEGLKEKTKDEIKKGIAEALEELGAEMKGKSIKSKARRTVGGRRKILGILGSLRRGIEDCSSTDSFKEDGIADTDSDEIGDRKSIEKSGCFEEESVEMKGRFKNKNGLQENVISDMEFPTGSKIDFDKLSGEKKESQQVDSSSNKLSTKDSDLLKREHRDLHKSNDEADEEGGQDDELNSEEEEKGSERIKKILKRLRKGFKQENGEKEDLSEDVSREKEKSEDQTQEPESIDDEKGLSGGGPESGTGDGSGGNGGGSGGSDKSGDEGPEIESYVFESVSDEEAADLPETDWEWNFSAIADEPEESKKKLRDVNEYYCLVPKNPEPGEDIYAYTHIYWDDEKNSLFYKVVEPELTEEDKKLLEEIKENIEERLDVDFDDVGKIKARGYISDRLDEVLEVLGKDLSEGKRKTIRYYLERDYIDMGKIDPFMRDPNIEEISCDGVGIPIFVYHRNAKYGSMETNVVFEEEEKLDTYVRRLGQTVGKTVSMANPLVDASLPDGSRLQATLGTDIARKGSNFTIRKFTENPLTPVDLIEFGTVDPRVLAYLWLAIENENSVLISGGTATGKTTMLNVISLFIRPEMKIVTIEDTAELRLPHDHWVPEVAREAIAKEDSDTVDMFKLLKESLRQRPDYIVVGEVRGAEAFVLFQQMSTGHPGLATIHAENPERLISRLTTKPIDLPPSLLSALDIVIFIRKVRVGDTLQRKIDQIVEIKRFSREENVPKMNRVFKWDASQDKLVNENPSLILKEVSRVKGKDEEELKNEVKDRERVIEWMIRESVRDLEDIGSIISRYYSDKESLMEKIDSTG